MATAARSTRRTALGALGRVEPATWGIVAITTVAAALRFASLSGQSFWLDESYALGDIRFHSLSGMLDWMRVHEMTPPLYFLLARAWTHVFGTGEVGFRSLSALLGTAVVPLVYASGVALRSRRLGLIAAAFAAVSPVMIWYSQEGRNYALVLFLAAVAFLAFAHLLRSDGRDRLSTPWLVTWWIASALMLDTHYFAIFFVAGLGLVLLLRFRSARIIGALATLAVVELVILPLALSASAHVGFDPIRAIPVPYRIAQVPSQLVWGPVEGRFGPWAIAAAAILLTGGAAFAALRSRDPGTRTVAVVAGTAAAVNLGVPVALTIVGIDYLTPRYLLPAWIPVAFLWAAPLARGGRRGAAVAVAGCAFLAAASAYLLASPSVQRQDWRSVAHALGPAPPGDRAVVAPRLGVPLRLYMTPDELDHGIAPSSLRQATVSEIAVVGTEGRHRQGCWWGGACQLPARLLPRAAPPAPGFRLLRTQTVGRFRLAIFRAPAPRTVSFARSTRLYRGSAGLGLFSFVQRP